MLRKDREITDKGEMLDVLKRCDTLRIAFSDTEYPYMVPVSFGIRDNGEDTVLYFHGAKKGHKAELIARSPKVCVEADIFFRVEETAHGITTRYESVIGTGTAQEAEGDEILDGLRAICEHYGRGDYPVEQCKGLAMTAVYRIRLESLSGKRNIPDE